MENDLIRRSDVMDKVEVINWYHVNADGKLVSGAAEEADAFIHYSDAVEAVEKAPAADVRENVKARWIDMVDHLLCSGCGATHYGADKNFCPNCGADCRGGG